MNARFMARLLAVVLAAVGVVAVGAVAYQLGLSDGAASATGGAQVVRYVGPWGAPSFGAAWGIFGLIFPLFFLFLFIGLIRAALWGGSRRDRWGYGPRPWGYGPRPDIEEWHRHLHEAADDRRRWPDDPAMGSGAPGAPGTPGASGTPGAPGTAPR